MLSNYAGLMNATHRSSHVTQPATAIDPAKAWMLGVLVDADWSLRAAPSVPLAFGSPDRRDDRRLEAETCTCPDYCEIEHDAV